jgi:cellobiose-specific phosphotransferase system component IIA
MRNFQYEKALKMLAEANRLLDEAYAAHCASVQKKAA